MKNTSMDAKTAIVVMSDVLSVEDDYSPFAIGLNAVERARRHDIHPAGVDGDRLAFHDDCRLTARDEESFRIIVALGGVGLGIQSQEFQFSASDFHCCSPVEIPPSDL